MNHLIKITKSDGSSQLFEEEKLVNSLKKAGATEGAIDEVVDEIEREMWEGMPTADIYHRAFELLKKRSHPAAIKYSIRRAMFELGPDGFPFEKFVAHIFMMWGYEAITDQIVMGNCVEHEVDVVAWKGDTLAMSEVKFHNEFGLKSDIKVALYVKARFDDIVDTVCDYGGVKRKLSEKYLFTNTKFTETATTYGACKDLKMISWNYPRVGNLHELIEKNYLYPITCLTTLTHQQKNELLSKNIILCKEIVANPAVLIQIGVKDIDSKRVLDEARVIASQMQ